MQPGKDWTFNNRFKISDLNIASTTKGRTYNPAKAYILAHAKVVDSSYDPRGEESSDWDGDIGPLFYGGHWDSASQVALWYEENGESVSIPRHFSSSAKTGGLKLYNDAKAFKEYRDDYSKIQNKTNMASVKVITNEDGTNKLGPYKINYSTKKSIGGKTFGGITNVIVNATLANGTTRNLTIGTEYSIQYKNNLGNQTEIKIKGLTEPNFSTFPKDKEFYIIVKNKSVVKINKITITEKEEDAYAEYFDGTTVDSKGKEIDDQNALFVKIAKIKKRYNSIELDANKDLTPPAKITLTKASSKGGNLSGAVFDVVATQGEEPLKSGTITTTGGKATFACQPTSRDKDVVITITEKTAPTGSGGIYKKLNSAMVITLKYDTSSNKWKATETTNTEGVLEITNATNIDIKVTNQFIAKIDLNLTKASSLGGNLRGAKFKVEASQDGGTVTPNSSTITTNSTGKATFTCQPTTEADVTIKITEIEKPTDSVGNYEKLNKTMVIKLTYNRAEHKWTATEITDEEKVLGITNATKVDITITNQYISPIKIGGDIDGFGGFDKVDQAGNPVVGAEFKAVFEQDGEKLATKTATSNTAGKLDFEEVKPKTTSNVRVTITETKAPAGYENSNYNKTIEFTYDKNSHTWNPLTNVVNAQVQYKNKTTYVDIDNVVNKSQIDKLTLIKRDSQDSSKLTGAKFRITLSNIEKIKKYNIASDPANIEVEIQNGELTLEELVIRDVTNPVIITLEETLAPKGYKKIEGTITLTITRVGTEYTIVTSADETVRASDEFRTDVIKLTPGEDGIVKGDVNKNGILDAGDALLILKNSVGKYDFDEELKKIADVTGDNRVNSADAQWVLSHKTSVPNSGSAIGLGGKGDVNGDGKITEADAEKILKYSVGLITEIDLEKADVDGNGVVNSADALRILKYLAGEKEGSTGNVTENNHKIEIRMNDIPIMNLGGIVWAEKEKSGKKPTPSDVYGDGNGNENKEEALGGITVRLKRKGTVVATMETATEDGGKTVKYLNNKGEEKTVSLNKGQYLFTNLEVGEDYTVEFDYDGIKYNTLKNTASEILYNTNKKSKISDENDKGLKEGTKTVSGSDKQDESIASEKYENIIKREFTIKYNLENKPYQSAIYDKTIDKDGEQVYVTATTSKYLQQKKHWLDSWKETSEAGVYEIDLRHYAFDVNCGLYEKYFDLNLGTDVDTATVSINGKQATYTYDQILDGKMDQDLNKTTYGQVTYNQYLSKSDYRYRIKDYNTKRNPNGTPTEADTETEEAINENKMQGNKLTITVNYRLLLNNQSTHTAYVNEVEYIYDDAYVYKGTNRTDITVKEVGNNKLKITQNGTSLELGDGAQQEIILTFAIRKNGDGTFVKDPGSEKEYVNKAEIVSYSTAEGRLIDADSAPGNAFLSGYEERYEDDTDKAAGIKVVFKTDDRIISGTVFDADDSKKPVDDVIVQLIEVKKLTNAHGEEKLYEYIWQETLSGSNKVYKTNVNGWADANVYTNGVESGSGNYEFKDFIPGKYIVRFIYGDGRVYDLTDNTLKYNGEDYKSTYNSSYDKEWYNTDNDLLTKDVSKAVDNEARRLKVMSYAVDVDASKGNDLEILDEPLHTDDNKLKDVLKNTWMAAETAKINVSVDSDDYIDETTEKEVKGNSVIADSTIGKGKNSGEPKFANTQFTNVNFGLMERPKTKLVLEKHITELTVTAQAGTPLTEARADIKDIMNAEDNAIITPEGKIDGLIAVKSTRYNRGQWYLQTDTTELGQGTTAKITYTYAITNKGDKDYLNEMLVNNYESNYNNYDAYLRSLENPVKDAMKLGTFTKGTYLGGFYYTGVKAASDKEVLATVEQIQEFINPELTYSGDDVANQIRKDTTVVMPVNKKRYTNEDVLGDINVKEKIESTESTGMLQIKDGDYSEENTDFDKRFMVEKVLSAQEIEDGGVYDSYLADITHYTNAAGRRDESTPDNLSYVHSEDTNMNLETYIYTEPGTNNVKLIVSEIVMVLDTATGTTVEEEVYTYYGNDVPPNGIEAVGATKGENGTIIYNGNTYTKLNEQDEFWAETFKITKPTGEDKLTPVQIAIITVSAVAILGVGIILIKKFVLKK